MTSGPPARGPQRVYLTGGTGFIGSHIAEALRSAGCAVRALHRGASEGSERLRALGCELVEGRLEDGAASLGHAMAGCDALVHAAAVVYSERAWPRLREINVGGSERVFRGGAAVGIRAGVHLSSVSVYGGAPGPVEEDTPIDTPLRPAQGYARSKRESERVVREAARGSGMAVTILRPSVVYGARDLLFTAKIARLLRLPVHPLLGRGRTPLAAVYAGNLADAVVRVLVGAWEGGEPASSEPKVYNLAGDFPLTQRALLGGLARRLGLPFRPLPIPGGVVRLGAAVGEAIGVRLPGAEELSLRRAAALALAPNPYRSERIRGELGWTPPIGVEEALDRTAEWIAGG